MCVVCVHVTALLDTCGLVASVPANVAVWDVAVCNAAMWQRTNVLGMNWHKYCVIMLVTRGMQKRM
jgi:hypothetical protein